MQTTLKFALCLLTGFLACLVPVPCIIGQTLQVVPTPVAVHVDSNDEVLGRAASHRDGGNDAERISALEESVRQQSAQLSDLRKLVLEQQETIKLLAAKLTNAVPVPPTIVRSGEDHEARSATVIAQTQPTPQLDDRLKKVEARVTDIGPVKFSGDIRLRSESLFGITNSLPSASNPAVFGNDLSWR